MEKKKSFFTSTTGFKKRLAYSWGGRGGKTSPHGESKQKGRRPIGNCLGEKLADKKGFSLWMCKNWGGGQSVV